MRRPCGFSLPLHLNALDRRVTTESELSRAGRSWCRGATCLASGGAARDKHLQSCQRTNEYARFVGWPATPIPLFERRRCSLRVMRRGFSFPSRAAFRYPQSQTFAASPDAAKYPTLPSRPATLLGSTAPFAGLFPQTGGQCVSASPGPRAVSPHPASPDRFHRAEFRDDSVLVGQRYSQPEMGSASGLGSRLWSPSTWAEASQLRPALGIPALGFVLFQVCGHAIMHHRGLDTATITSP